MELVHVLANFSWMVAHVLIPLFPYLLQSWVTTMQLPHTPSLTLCVVRLLYTFNPCSFVNYPRCLKPLTMLMVVGHFNHRSSHQYEHITHIVARHFPRSALVIALIFSANMFSHWPWTCVVLLALNMIIGCILVVSSSLHFCISTVIYFY